jgi:uncharacterized protein (DUF736 family)
MATIGSFKKVGGEFQGEIVTLSVQAKSRSFRKATAPGGAPIYANLFGAEGGDHTLIWSRPRKNGD